MRPTTDIQNSAVVAKRLLLLHDVLPKAVRIAALVNPGTASVTKSTTRELEKAAPTMGLQVQILPATTIGEIDAAFATFAGEPPMPSSSRPTHSSSAAAHNLSPWRRVTGFRRFIRPAILCKPAG